MLNSRVRICVFHVYTYVCFHRIRGVPGHKFVFQWYAYVCPTCIHMCVLIARVCVPGEHMCVLCVHTCVSELVTCFIVFQVKIYVCFT